MKTMGGGGQTEGRRSLRGREQRVGEEAQTTRRRRVEEEVDQLAPVCVLGDYTGPCPSLQEEA